MVVVIVDYIYFLRMRGFCINFYGYIYYDNIECMDLFLLNNNL